MQIKKYLRSAAILLPMVLSIAIAQPGIRRSRQQSSRVQNVERLKVTLKEMGINEATIEKIADITQDYNKFLTQHLIQLQKESLSIKEALLVDADISTIEPLVLNKAKIVTEIEIEQIKRDMAIKSLLTPEEFSKWKSRGQMIRRKKGGFSKSRKNQRKKVEKKPAE